MFNQAFLTLFRSTITVKNKKARDNLVNEQDNIKHVAIYLRKSRDEGEYDDVLSKHRDTLVAIAESRNWTYKLYEEIGSGESIAKRKKMQQLLIQVDNGILASV